MPLSKGNMWHNNGLFKEENLPLCHVLINLAIH